MEHKRFDFLRYYGLKAGVNFSLGSHDEWLIYHALNTLRRDKTRNPVKFMADGDVGDQIAGFFDGGQIDPASSETGGVARLLVSALVGGPAMPDRGSRRLSSRPAQRTA